MTFELFDGSLDEPATLWDRGALYQHGGRAFDLWRDVVDSYILLNNFLVDIGAPFPGEYMLTDRPKLEFNQAVIMAARIRSRLDGVGVTLETVRPYNEDPIGHYIDLLRLLAKVERAFLQEAYQSNFNNEAPARPANTPLH